jgi:uncharacterized protein YjbI with pentapeptide repeats
VTSSWTRWWSWTGFASKTLWDWLELLVVPFVLAAVALGFNYFAAERDRNREERQAARERALALDASRDEALRVYLEQMSRLILERNLLHSRRGSQVQGVAQASTLTVLRRLNASRKATVVQFLSQAGLIGRARTGVSTLSLYGADLRRVPLADADLSEADLSGTDLRGADFRRAVLAGARLVRADLRNANFAETNMRFADLRNACVSSASFANAVLAGADLSMTAGRRVNFSFADLSQAYLRDSLLTEVDTTTANMRGAVLPQHWARTGRTDVNPAEVDAYCKKFPVLVPVGR